MDANDYQAWAATKANDILSMPERVTVAALGLASESGEVCGYIKKHLGQGHDLPLDEVIKEMGDVAFYLAELATALGVSLSVVLQENRNKLDGRYPRGFEASRSVDRSHNDRAY